MNQENHNNIRALGQTFPTSVVYFRNLETLMHIQYLLLEPAASTRGGIIAVSTNTAHLTINCVTV